MLNIFQFIAVRGRVFSLHTTHCLDDSVAHFVLGRAHDVVICKIPLLARALGLKAEQSSRKATHGRDDMVSC